jgi:hypothetical protein
MGGRNLFDSELILLTIKIVYAVFLCVLVPVYWRWWGPANFLWFSDIALFLTFVGVWLESPLLVSMQAVSVMLLEMVWIFDFVLGSCFRIRLTGIADYMFKSDQPFYVRALSLFHLVLPFLLFWLVLRFGYDTRAWIVQTALAWIVLLISFAFTKPSDNINWTFGPGSHPQHKIPRGLYLFLLMLFFPLCVYFPTHCLLKIIVGE